jgi:hypothetical protein
LAVVKLKTVQVTKVPLHDLLCRVWTDRGLVYSAKRRIFNATAICAIRTLDKSKAKPIHKRQTIISSVRMLHKDYDRKSSVAKKNLWS